MGFHDVRMPEELEYGSVGGPYFQTQVSTTDAGFEQRISRWNQVRHKYTVQMKLTWLLGQQLREFYIARQGAAHSFRFKDWMDYRTPATGFSEGQGGATISPTDQVVGVADGVTSQFQLAKRYTSGDTTRVRTISKPVEGTVSVAVSGVTQPQNTWSIDYNTGLLSFSSAPTWGEITWGGEFDVECRFSESADKLLHLRWESHGSISINNLELVEVMSQDSPSDEVYYGGSFEGDIDAEQHLGWSSPMLQVLDPYEGDAMVTLPAPDSNSPHSGGPFFVICHGGPLNVITVNDASTSTVVTISAGESYMFFLLITPTGHQWYAV